MGREDYVGRTDPQPPMCGGAVFDLFRSRNTDRGHHQPLRSFDERPLRTNSDSILSVESLGYSQDEIAYGPRTALLNDSSRSGRSNLFFSSTSKKGNSMRDIIHPKADVSVTQTTSKTRPGGSVKMTRNIGGNSNTNSQVNNSHIRPPPSATTSSSRLDVVLGGGGGSCKEPSSSSSSSSTTTTHNENAGEMDNNSSKMMMTPEAVIEKLEMEKKAFETETSMLREEMQLVRKQLEAFQTLVMQQVQQKQEEERSRSSTPPLVETKTTLETESSSSASSSISSSLSARAEKGAAAAPIAEFDLSTWEIPEGVSAGIPEESQHDAFKNDSFEEKSDDFSPWKTEHYWQQALEMGNQESDDSNEEEEDDDDSNDDENESSKVEDETRPTMELTSQEEASQRNESLLSTTMDDPPVSIASERTVELHEEKVDDQFERNELARDIEFVQKLLEKYRRGIGSSATKSLHDGTSVDSQKATTTAIVPQIDNSRGDVRSSSTSRHMTIEKIQTESQRGGLHKSDQKSLPLDRTEQEDSVVTSGIRNQDNERLVSPPTPVKTGTPEPKSHYPHRPSPRNFRYLKQRRFLNRDDQGENKFSRANIVPINSNTEHDLTDSSRNPADAKQQQQQQQQQQPQQQVTEKRPSAGRQWNTSSSKNSPRREEHAVVVDGPESMEHLNMSLHSKRSEAEDIDFSTSVHNSIFWSQSFSRRGERTSDHPKAKSLLTEGTVSSSDSSDVMDCLQEQERNQRQDTTDQEVREVPQIGRGGVTYNIQVKDTPVSLPLTRRQQQYRDSKNAKSLSSSSDSGDVMDGLEEQARNLKQHFKGHGVREVPQIARGGGTYKIQIKDTAVTTQVASQKHGQGKSGKCLYYTEKLHMRSDPAAFRGHAGEYKHVGKRLI